MVRRLWNTAIERAGLLALDELPDAELLARFLADRAGPAFPAVVRRHGPLVWGVCRNLLPAEADAEDAFQATFLALVRGADRIRQPNALGAWLHGVAGRVCRNSLRAKARRDRHERSAAVPEANAPVAADAWDRWQAVVHEEVDRLPRPLREAFVLCVLQGVRQPDAAKRLGWSLGSVSGRVCQAKKRLVEALGRRGLSGAAGAAAVFGSGVAAGPVSAGLMSRATGFAAGGPVPHGIHELATAATGGLMGKTKLLLAGLLAAGLAVGTGLIPTAEGQVLPGSSSAQPGTGPGPGGPYPTGPGVGAPGPGSSSGFGPGAMPGTGAPSTAIPRVEYKYVSRPKDEPWRAETFKRILAAEAAGNWEYVGTIPDVPGELIFKRPPPRPHDPFAGAGSMGPPMSGPGMPGAYGPSAPGPRPVGSSNVPPPGAGGPVGPGMAPGGTSGGPPRFAGEGNPFVPGTPPSAGDPSVPGGPMPGVGEVAKRTTPAEISLATGETIRHRMTTGAEIDRIRVTKGGGGLSKVADVTLDPVNGKRIVIAAAGPRGDMTVELTDANGVKETYTIRVK